MTIDDLKQFRQWGVKTPGHPEVNHTDGVEATTGPLGQGDRNGCGDGNGRSASSSDLQQRPPTLLIIIPMRYVAMAT